MNGLSECRYRRDVHIVETLTVGDAIAHEHWDTIEFQSVNLDAGFA